ncbi:MAG: phytanoyl-CoA dioxygenase family protein [Ardenticatenaceae bacterium]
MSRKLSFEQLDFFHENGYLVVENVLNEAALQALWDEYAMRLDEVVQGMVKAGLLSEAYDDLPFDERYCAVLRENSDVFQHLEIAYPLENENFPVDAPIHTGPAVFGLLSHPNLLDVVESIIGSEIYSNPVQHIRLKPPYKKVPRSIAANSYIGKTTWHQDQGALLDEANETQILTTWVAITDCPKEFGCLIVVPGSHRKNELSVHCPGKGITSENFIPVKLLGDENGHREIVPLPCKRGDVVLLHQFTEHAALRNKSDQLRWSFDLRWNPIGQPTGRPAFPGFVARSRQNPDNELRDPAMWSQLWHAAKERILNGDYSGQIFNAERWTKYVNAPVCA